MKRPQGAVDREAQFVRVRKVKSGFTATFTTDDGKLTLQVTSPYRPVDLDPARRYYIVLPTRLDAPTGG